MLPTNEPFLVNRDDDDDSEYDKTSSFNNLENNVVTETFDYSLNENSDNNDINNDDNTTRGVVELNDNGHVAISRNENITIDNLDNCIRTRSGRNVRIPARYKE